MSKYTTELRFICERASGLSESVGASQVDQVLDGCWEKIFTTKTEFFDEAYRPILCKKILKHYYLREIGTEVVGIWSLWMNTKMEEIMPYYNRLYKAVLKDFDPFSDVDLTRTHTTKGGSESSEERSGKSSTTETGQSASNDTTTINAKSDSTAWDMFSDTPQGAITDLDNNTYLTNARKNTDKGSTSTSNIGNSTVDNTSKLEGENSENRSGKTNTLEEYSERVIGKQGTQSYSKMLQEFMEAMKNIDMMVVDEFKDMFMLLW